MDCKDKQEHNAFPLPYHRTDLQQYDVPKLLLLDEPTAFLDVPHILSLFHFLRELAEKKQMAILLSTHHLDYAFRFSHRVIALDGKGGIGEGFLPKMQEAGRLSWAKE